MKRVAIVHHTFPGLGGGERLVLSVVEALNSIGIVPDVFTRRPVSPDLLRRTYGKALSFRYRPVRRLLPYGGERFILYRKVATSFIFAPRGYDAVFNSAVGEFSPIRSRMGLDRETLYIFNPYFDWPERQRGVRWAYTKAYRAIVVAAVRAMEGRVLVNSEYTARRVKELWGISSKVLYSPIDIASFAPTKERERSGIINVGRFSPEKRQDLAIRIASMAGSSTELTLVGSTVTPDSTSWLTMVRSLAESTKASVRVLPNLSFDSLREELWKAKVYLHTFPREDQGLAPLEAVAAGCIPIVPDYGGNIETVPLAELRYRSLDEAAKKVASALRGDYDDYLPRLKVHLEKFGEAPFQAGLLSALGFA